MKETIIKDVLVELSARHVHLSKKDAEKLFGNGYKLKNIKELSQKDFLTDKRVSIIYNDKEIKNVAVLGPERNESQVEISLTDAVHLRMNPLPRIKESGDLNKSSGITLGYLGKKINLERGLIIAKRHLHVSEEEANKLALKNGQIINAVVHGERKTSFHDIPVRIKPHFSLALHLDTDECNASGIYQEGRCEIIKNG